jgi:hypothetical protein
VSVSVSVSEYSKKSLMLPPCSPERSNLEGWMRLEELERSLV